MRSPLVIAVAFAAFVAALAPGAAQDLGLSLQQPFVFFTPRLTLASRGAAHDKLFDGLDSTVAFPFSEHISATATLSIHRSDPSDVTLLGNYDWWLGRSLTLRSSGGIIGGQTGAMATAFFNPGGFTYGANLGFVGGDLQFGGFVVQPFAWGFPLRHETASQLVKGRNRVTALGGGMSIDFSVRDSRGDLTTHAAYVYPRERDWPRFAADAQGGASSSAAFSPDAHLAWTFATKGAVRSSAAVVRDTAYVGSDDGFVYALNTRTGEERWRFGTRAAVRSSPAVQDDRVYVGSDDGGIYCVRYDPRDQYSTKGAGSQLWRFQTRGPVVASPLVTAGGLVVVGSRDGTCYALEARTGRQRWSVATSGEIVASVAKTTEPVSVADPNSGEPVPESLLFCASTDGTVYALAEPTGAVVWQTATGGAVRSTPVVLDQAVYVANADGRVLALEAGSGTVRWTQEVGDAVEASLAVTDKQLLVLTRQGHMRALDLATGDALWDATAASGFTSTPAAPQKDVFFVGGLDKQLHAFSRRNGEPLWSYSTQGPISASPAIAHGLLVIGSQDGIIYGFSDKDGVEVAVAPPAAVVAPEEAPVVAPTEVLPLPPATDEAPAPADDFPRPYTAPPTNLPPDAVGMSLLVSPSDSAEMEVELVDRPAATLQCASDAPLMMDGRRVEPRDGVCALNKAFPGDGTYVVPYAPADKPEAVQNCRLVVVDSRPVPTSTRALAFSPDGNGIADAVRLRVTAEPASGVEVDAVSVTIVDAAGQVVRSFSQRAATAATFTWDGTDYDGHPVPNGEYQAVASAHAASGGERRIVQALEVGRTR